MTKRADKCSQCGVAVKVFVRSEEKAETSVMCKQCEIEGKMEQVVAAQSDLVKRIGDSLV